MFLTTKYQCIYNLRKRIVYNYCAIYILKSTTEVYYSNSTYTLQYILILYTLHLYYHYPYIIYILYILYYLFTIDYMT